MLSQYQALAQKTFLIGSILIFAGCLAVLHLGPWLKANEVVYLLSPLRQIYPELYGNDWSLNAGSSSFGTVYSYFMRPFFTFTEDLLQIAIASRIVLWAGVSASIYYLGCQLNLKASSIFTGLFLFLATGQGAVAGEWLYGGSEQKIIAYIFIFLALASLSKKRYGLCGLWTGLSFCSHVVVGGWSALAIGLVLLSKAFKNPQPLIRFAIPALPIAIGMLAVVFSGGVSFEVGTAIKMDYNIYEFFVRAVTSEHLDPFFFFSPISALACALIFFAAIFLSMRRLLNFEQNEIMFYLVFLGCFAVLGVLARSYGFYQFLILYPFRVADLLFPLIAILLSVDYLQRLVISEWMLEKRRWPVLLGIGLGVLIALYPVSRQFYWELLRVQGHWQQSSSETDLESMHFWIRDNTEPEAIVISDPCSPNFWAESRRATIVKLKFVPVDQRIVEWRQRMIDLGGGNNIGLERLSCNKRSEFYRTLSKDQIAELGIKYNAHYFLVDKSKPELSSQLEVSFGQHHLYRTD